MTDEAPIDVSYILNHTPEEIMHAIMVRKTVAPIESNELSRVELEKAKKGLQGFFKADPALIKRGQTVKVGAYFLDIVSVLPSTERVFFTFRGILKTFSLSIGYLVGKDATDFPYAKGDRIEVYGIEYIVHGINPASKSVTVKVDGKTKKFSIDKIRKVELTNCQIS